VLARLPDRRTILLIPAVLLALHVFYHGERIQRRVHQLRAWGQADEMVIGGTLDRALRQIPRGTTICAVGWTTEDAFVRCMGALYLEPEGYRLAGGDELDLVVRAYREGDILEPWIALYDERTRRFGVMPLSAFQER
jgi:hypothetical protein